MSQTLTVHVALTSPLYTSRRYHFWTIKLSMVHVTIIDICNVQTYKCYTMINARPAIIDAYWPSNRKAKIYTGHLRALLFNHNCINIIKIWD